MEKVTIYQLFPRYLNKKKISHIKIREPGGNPNSEKIRKLILNNKSNFNKILICYYIWLQEVKI